MTTTAEPLPAIGGYDPLTYFDGSPELGSPRHSYIWEGRVWHFTSAEHRDRFAASPARYAPQFGGHCAFAMSIGKTAHASPKQWTIVDGKLYLQQNPVARFLFRTFKRSAHAQKNWATQHGR